MVNQDKSAVTTKLRDVVLNNLTIDSTLRGCDVIAAKVADVAPSGHSKGRLAMRPIKTGPPVLFELTDQTRQAIDTYLRMTEREPSQILLAGRGGGGGKTARQPDVMRSQ